MLIKNKTKSVSSSKDAADVFKAVLAMRGEEDQHKECFYVMGLNSQNTVLYIDLIAIGTVNRCTPEIREAMRQALIKNAAGIIVCHNHPSGDTEPSREDDDFTTKLEQACNVLGVKLLDHLILGDNYYSFSDNGRV